MGDKAKTSHQAIGAMLRRDVPPAGLRDHARAVAPGFDELWIVEDLPYAGGISQATAVLEATAGMGEGVGPVVGHGIAPGPFRNPAVLAMVGQYDPSGFINILEENQESLTVKKNQVRGFIKPYQIYTIRVIPGN